MSAYAEQGKNVRRTWLLIFLFIGVVSALFYIVGAYFGSPTLAIIGFIISVVQALVAYYGGHSIALSIAGAKEVSPEEAPQIHLLVENLTKIAGIPKPKIYISPDPSANAFATGRDPEHAHLCFNKGLLAILDKNELEGVIAHELAHVKNRDILIMTVTMVLASLISLIADISLRSVLWGGDRRSSRDNQSPLIFIFFILAIILATIVSTMIQLAVSRKREFLADATAVTLTRYPKGLVNALEKLYQNPIPSSHYSTSTNHFYISPPKQNYGQKISGLFSTHPSIEDRVAALEKMG